MYEVILYSTIGAVTFVALKLQSSYRLKGQFPEEAKNIFYLIVVVMRVFFAVAAAVILDPSSPLLSLFIGFTTPLFLDQMLKNTASSLEINQLDENLLVAENIAKNAPEKIKPAWDVSRIQLQKYISRNQDHVRSIYRITVLVILAGFCLIGFGVFKVINNSGLDAAILTTCAGVITEMIGATLLVIYKSTISQAASYIGTLERINGVGMALEIIDKIPSTDIELRNKVLADIALKIVEMRVK